MKNFLCTLFVVLFTFNAWGQETPGIYYKDLKLGYSRISGQKLGNLAGAYFSLGLSGAKRDLIIEGKMAELIITEKRPSFTVVFGDSTAIPAIFHDPTNFDYLVLVELKKGKHERKLQTGSYGLTGVESNLSGKYLRSLKVEQISQSAFVITPKEDLKKGEYGIYFNIPEPKDDDESTKNAPKPFRGVFDFSIL